MEKETMKEHPLKTALILMGLPLLFMLPLWVKPITNLFNLICHPSIAGLFGLIFEWHFLLLVVFYLSFALLFYSGALRELRDRYDESKKKYQENLDILQNENNRIIETNKPKNN